MKDVSATLDVATIDVSIASALRRHMLIQALLLGSILLAGVLMVVTGFVPPVFHAFLNLTGVPDPMCGMRTGTLALMRGDLHNALEANPLSLFFTPFSVAMIADRIYRFRTRRLRRRLSRREKRLLSAGITLVICVAWFYQLIRFGLIL